MEFAAEAFGGRLVLTCSWQLGTSILVHMTRQVAPETRLVEIDTGLLFPETHATRERLVDHYGLEVETLRPLQTVEEQAADARRGALGARPRPLLRPAQGRAARAGDPRRRRLADGHPPRPDLARAPRAPKLVLDAAPRRRQGAAAGRLERARLLALHLPERHSVQRAARPRVPLDRLHAVHARRPGATRTRARAAGPAAASPSAACTSSDARLFR